MTLRVGTKLGGSFVGSLLGLCLYFCARNKWLYQTRHLRLWAGSGEETGCDWAGGYGECSRATGAALPRGSGHSSDSLWHRGVTVQEAPECSDWEVSLATSPNSCARTRHHQNLPVSHGTGITDQGTAASPHPPQTRGDIKGQQGTVPPPGPPSPLPALASPHLPPAAVPQTTALPKHPSPKPGPAPLNSPCQDCDITKPSLSLTDTGTSPKLPSPTPAAPPAPHLQQLLLPHMRTSRPPQQMVQ